MSSSCGCNDAGSGGRELTAVHVANRAEQDLSLLLADLAQVEQDDPALVIREHREREADRSLAEFVDGIEAVLLADQDRVIDADLLRVLDDVLADVDRNADDLKAFGPMLFLQLAQQRDLAPARATPRRPEVHDQRLAGPAADRGRLAGQIAEREVGKRLGHRGRFFCSRWLLGLRRSGFRRRIRHDGVAIDENTRCYRDCGNSNVRAGFHINS